MKSENPAALRDRFNVVIIPQGGGDKK